MPSADTLTLLAPAKINLFLHVTGRLPNGYHTLQTLYQFLDFCDDLAFNVTDHGEINRIDDHDFKLPAEDLIVRAAKLMHSFCADKNTGVDITLRKRIPAGAGLGGGSSDAATTILALNRLWKLNLPEKKLLEIALQLGADVPVFVFGHAAWAEGIGEILLSKKPPEHWYCLVLPNVEVATSSVFNHKDIPRQHATIDWQDYQAGNHCNDLENVVRQSSAEVDKAWLALNQFGSPRMNGSGASVFLQCDSQSEARSICNTMPETLKAIYTRSMNEHPAKRQLDN